MQITTNHAFLKLVILAICQMKKKSEHFSEFISMSIAWICADGKRKNTSKCCMNFEDDIRYDSVRRSALHGVNSNEKESQIFICHNNADIFLTRN